MFVGMNLVVNFRVRQLGAAAGLVVAGLVAARDGLAARPQRAGGGENRWSAVVERAPGDGAAMTSLRSALSAGADPALRLEALRAIEATENPGAALMPVVAGVLLQPVDAETLLAALRALGGFRQREAVGEVLRFAASAKDIHQSPELAAQALATLARQTGRTDPANEVESWRTWFETTAGMNDGAWGAMIAGFHAERSKLAEARRAESESRLAGVYRRLLVSLPEKDRSGVIAEMIRASSAEVRALGVDQATRAVLNAVDLGPEVASAAMERLADPDQTVRAEMGTLLEKLEDPRIAASASAALERESSPVPAAAILRVLARHPHPASLRDVAVWLDSLGPAFAPAVDAALALDRAGAMTDPDLVARVREVLSALPMSRHTPGTVALLARVGGAASVAGLIDAPTEEVSIAAAQAVIDAPEFTDRVVAAAGRRAALFEPAVRTLAKHRPTAAGFALAEALTPPSAERGAAVLSEYAAALPRAALIEVAERQRDLSVRERLLASAGAATIAEGPEVPSLLARTRLQLKDPGAALAGIESVCPTSPDAVGPSVGAAACDSWAAPLRVTALAWLGRVEDAVAETRRVGLSAVGIASWLEALEGARASAHAPKIAAAVRELYSATLTAEQSARLDEIEGR